MEKDPRAGNVQPRRRPRRRRVGGARRTANSTGRETPKQPKGLTLFINMILIQVVSILIGVSLASFVAQDLAPPSGSSGLNLIQDGSFPSKGSVDVLPAGHQRPNVRVNIREWTNKVGEDIRMVANRTSCSSKIELAFEREAEHQLIDPMKIRENILNQINGLLAQHRAALNAIVTEAEKAAMAHNFIKNLRVNYTDVHRLRNELDPMPANTTLQDLNSAALDPANNQAFASQGSLTGMPQFTSIGGGTPVPGPPEWQTPFKSIVMQVNKNFGDIPVNTSMSAVHLPLPIYPGLPNIMNGIAWTEKLDIVFKRNLLQYMHVHHQYYGSHLGFLRTFPAHKWRIPRFEPDLFDARTRPWYVAGASLPKDVIILIDTSGSMTGLRREIAKGVVFEILDTLTNNDHFSVLRFSETITPVGLPKCNLKTPRLVPQLELECPQMSREHYLQQPSDVSKREFNECSNYKRAWDARKKYLEDNPNALNPMVADNSNGGAGSKTTATTNASYLDDDSYKKSIFNVTQDIRDAYLLPATSRNIRYLKSNFSMPTAGIANFTHALMGAFELLNSYNRTGDQGSQCNQAIMLITDGAIRAHEEIFNRYNYPNANVRLFTYMIGREVGDIGATKAMACRNRGYYTHVINLGEVREQVQKYLPVMARPLVLAHNHPISWTNAYGDETHQVLTDWVLEIKRRERARIMLNEERERLSESNSSDVINIELTNLPEYDELPQVDEELKNRIICEDDAAMEDTAAMEQSLQDEIDPLGYNELACHWTQRRADLLTSVVKPVFDLRNTSVVFERVLSKNIWTEKETHVRNAQLLGVAAVDLRVADIIKAAPSHLLGPNGYAILMGQNGFLMHHPDFRALLEDPFDKQSKILKPYFSSVDLTHIEQVYHNDSTMQQQTISSDHSANSGVGQVNQRRRGDDIKLFKLREAAVRRGTGVETIYVKRVIDCKRRPHVRRQSFYYGPIKDTPYAFMLALPQSYGLNRLSAKLPLDSKTKSYLTPSNYDLWTIHPDYRYCEQIGQSTSASPSLLLNQQNQPVQPNQNDSLATLIKLIEFAASGNMNAINEIEYEDLSAISGISVGDLSRPNVNQRSQYGQQGSINQQKQSSTNSGSAGERYICDKELFPSLLFDAKATYEPPDSTCGAYFENCERPSFSRRAGQSSSSSSSSGAAADDFCPKNADEMSPLSLYLSLIPRTKLAEIYGLELSFLATRSGLTRTRVYDLSARIKKLADLFILRHNKAVDEAWYARTVDWSMRFNEEATLISVPFNAYVRLIAKLRQRITQRHPAANNTLSNCDPALNSGDDTGESAPTSAAGSNSTADDDNDNDQQQQPPQTPSSTGANQQSETAEPLPSASPLINDDRPNGEDPSAPMSSSSSSTPTSTSTELPLPELAKINYNEYSSFDFLDLLANSSVHVAATQSVIVNKRTKQRTAVAVTGHLYDYATFARRFLNSTTLSIRTLDQPANSYDSMGGGAGGGPLAPVKVDICPGGQCPTQCGLRNDTIDCLLVDNNGYIVVGEELPHVGRSLVDYDEKLMLSLVERKVFYQIDYVDYQAICARPNEQIDAKQQQAAAAAAASAATASAAAAAASAGGSSSGVPSASSSSSSSAMLTKSPFKWEIARSLAVNFASAILWTMSTVYSAFFLRSTVTPPLEDLFAEESLLGQLYHWQRSAILAAEAQSAIANQSLLALLPNKTYLRACERTQTLYETRPTSGQGNNNDANSGRLFSETPEYFVTKCGCSGWYVYDSVPKTNLLMLIVNTTSACSRRCESSGTQPTVALTGPPASPLAVPIVDTTIQGSAISVGLTGGPPAAPNKTAEDQVCAMLERDAQLYVQRPTGSCLTSHPEEAHIHLCGRAAGIHRPSLASLMLLVCSLQLLYWFHLFKGCNRLAL